MTAAEPAPVAGAASAPVGARPAPAAEPAAAAEPTGAPPVDGAERAGEAGRTGGASSMGGTEPVGGAEAGAGAASASPGGAEPVDGPVAGGFPGEGVSRGLVVALAHRPAAGFLDARGHAGAPPWPDALRRHNVGLFATLPELPDATERPITADQTHRSVVVGERVVVKWFHPPIPPPHRALDLLQHLSVLGFGGVPTTYAALFGPDNTLAALMNAYLPEAVDGWEWCVDAVMAGVPVGALLGNLTADLHAALATPSAIIPTPVQPGDGTGWHDRALSVLDDALALTGYAWLWDTAPRLRQELRALADPRPTPVLRIHGDLHVGQVLCWRGGHAIVDFDGNPTVSGDAPQPAARDVAQMLTSIEHVGQVAIRRRGAEPAAAAAWVGAERGAFDRAYRSRLSDHGRSELLDERLLAPFAVEQECRELVYAARFLPRWSYAPMGVLRSWFGAG